MSVTLDEAIARMQATGDWSFEEDSLWSAQDILEFEDYTTLSVPEQLAAVLMRYGWNGFEQPDIYANFVVTYEDGGRSAHEVQVLVSGKKRFYDRHDMFISSSTWPDQFTLPMIFFGTADGGNSYLLMNGQDKTDNRVWLWEQASDPFGTGNNARGLGFAAPSLYEFFYNLKKADEI